MGQKAVSRNRSGNPAEHSWAWATSVKARNRRQGRVAGQPAPVAIIEHPDVRRMLLSMKARVEAMRALCYCAALELDRGHREKDDGIRAAALARAELLTPIVKGWCTETAMQVTSTGVQVH